MREAIRLKYSLIRYYYTCFQDMSTKGTGTLFKPLFFEFPDDIQAMQNISQNIMLGSALKLSITTDNSKSPSDNYYFPKGLWCRLKGNTGDENCFDSPGMMKTYNSSITDF